ncbi:MAG: DUF192 domain-containing protein [Coriobacteriia bacterium]|nr:DUF192 domain-containing protein [Coriobacteriia bacterium]
MSNPDSYKYFDVRIAKRPLKRLIGLINDGALDGADALMITHCSSIHSFGMRTSIDVAFIDAEGKVLRSIRSLPPSRLASCRGSKAVLERYQDDNSAWLEPGDQLFLWEPTANSPQNKDVDERIHNENLSPLPER